MFKMLAQAWKALEVLFKSFERIANSINNLAEWGEETSASFVDEARNTRAKAMVLAKKDLAAAK